MIKQDRKERSSLKGMRCGSAIIKITGESNKLVVKTGKRVDLKLPVTDYKNKCFWIRNSTVRVIIDEQKVGFRKTKVDCW